MICSKRFGKFVLAALAAASVLGLVGGHPALANGKHKGWYKQRAYPYRYYQPPPPGYYYPRPPRYYNYPPPGYYYPPPPPVVVVPPPIPPGFNIIIPFR